MEWIVGIDEVGRGALAGPVVVAAAMMPRGFVLRNCPPGKLKDSKKLSVKQREAWVSYFAANPGVEFAIARVYPRQIEKRNISCAANLAAGRAFGRLAVAHNLKANTQVFLDGGLFLGNNKSERSKHGKTIIKGDEKISAIKIASIVAKVHRDGFMCKLAKSYPAYGFEIHKGYGTKVHRRALRKHGPSPVHRLTFVS